MKKVYIFTIVIVVLLVTILGVYIHSISGKSAKNQTSKENIEDKQTINDIKSEKDLESKENHNIIENDNDNKIVKENDNEKYPNNNYSNSKNNENNSKNTINNSKPIENNNVYKEEPKNEEQVQNKCIPKKFDMSYVRADFNSMSKCTELGDKYKAIGYGYFCDSYQDDCGDTYYMLTLYERNTGNEFDFHNIELPN